MMNAWRVFGRGASTVGLAAILFGAGPARAQGIDCSGPFAKDSSHRRIVESFGAANVSLQKIYVAEGEETRGTVIFAKEPQRRIEVIWWDEKSRSRPSMIRIRGAGWTGPRGIKVGASLADVEAANGRPFTLSGFSWDFGGYVTGFQGGALASVPGGCNFVVRFDPDPKAPEARLARVLGDQEFSSSLPAMKAVSPKVSEISLGYPE